MKDKVVASAFARAGLLGNPSDGYNGKTISLTFSEFQATVTLIPSEKLTIESRPTANTFDSIHGLREQVAAQGYYGAERLLKAAIKRFADYCNLTDIQLPARNFSMSFTSNIPRQVGLAGSSAIVTAALRGMMQWYDVQIPPHLLASLTLSAEAELNIPAGLQDRVIQAYQGVVFMDFSKEKMQQSAGLDFGEYTSLAPETLSRLFVAYANDAGEPTEVLHNNLRQRFDAGDREVTTAMLKFADLAEQGRAAILSRDMDRLSDLINQNFALRESICELHPKHVQLVRTAQSVSASGKYCGSGGAIIGVLPDEGAFDMLQKQMQAIDAVAFRPTL